MNEPKLTVAIRGHKAAKHVVGATHTRTDFAIGPDRIGIEGRTPFSIVLMFQDPLRYGPAIAVPALGIYGTPQRIEIVGLDACPVLIVWRQ